MDYLRTFVQKTPVIDNHCHNILTDLSSPNHAFDGIVSEASGNALTDSAHSLARLRAEKQLKELYLVPNIDTVHSWEDLQKVRDKLLQSDQPLFVSRSLNGIKCMLIDDGFGNKTELQPYQWHTQFIDAPARRILRIESVAETLLDESLFANENTNIEDLHNVWSAFKDQFVSNLITAIHDTDVVAFKSIICYRSGLDISNDYATCLDIADNDAISFLRQCQEHHTVRFESFKSLNDYLVLQTLHTIQTIDHPYKKPVQFHTGHGDADLELRLANPVHLQRLVEKYPIIPFVLLHSAYPYTREAGYLTAQYSNVYLDLGLVFPTISKDGQVSILRQSLELSPYTKLLFSTDGHFFPETYWLSIKQFREALEEVRSSFCTL
jgi:predicted TIM-barrel fold metal-dependent hydrolase